MTALLSRFAHALRAIIGVPDYDRYVAHRRLRHPGEPVMSREAFTRECLTARYERPGSRCC